MQKLFLTLLVLSTNLYAESFIDRMNETYLKVDKNFDIDCRYSFNKTNQLVTPVSSTQKTNSTIERSFNLHNEKSSISMKFQLRKNGKGFSYFITFGNEATTSGELGKRDFYIAPVSNSRVADEYETSQIFCSINFAYEYPYKLTDGNYHINVHPHKRYDWQSLLKENTEKYLNDPSYKSIVLLDTGNYRGNLVDIETFLSNRPYSLPQNDYDSELINVPVSIPLLVSPAGHNRYEIEANSEVNVTFTGGNHNYCIWNNTRRVLEGLMRSKSLARINIYYDAYNTVAQQRGIEGMRLNFSRRSINHSNRLSSLLADQSAARGYHDSYYYYFKNYFFNEFKGSFRSVKLLYKAKSYQKNDTIQGNGSRDLEINLVYINQ